VNPRHKLLIFCVLVLVVVLILTSSLHDVHFELGRSLLSPGPVQPPVALEAIDALQKTPLWKILLFWAAFLINLILFFFLLPPELRKRVIRQVIRFALGVLILLIALRYKILEFPSLNSEPVNSGGAVSFADSGPQAAAFHPPEITSWTTYLISLGLILVLLSLTWIGYRWWARQRLRRVFMLDEIGAIARSSLEDLASGREWGDVVIQSYVRMSEVVGARRGLYRPEAMTPREFAERLEHAGLPAEGVRRLTQLFESVRYGARKSGPSDVGEAVACLHSILQACGASA
jgi:hypothetical protein